MKEKITAKKVITVTVSVLLLCAIILGVVYVLSIKDAMNYIDVPIVKIHKKDLSIVDKTNGYLAHPDLVMTDAGKLICMYPSGHGKGAIVTKTSDDYGNSWSERLSDTPPSWEKSQETPTLYHLDLSDGSTKLILVSGNPIWGDGSEYYANGFNCSVSCDDGKTWSEFENFYGVRWAAAQPSKPTDYDNLSDENKLLRPDYDDNGNAKAYDAIVAMSSLTRLKENGVYVDRWLGTFHDHAFVNYATILTFDESGNAQWSQPRRYLETWRSDEELSNICEVEIIRPVAPNDNVLILMARANSRKTNSIISFSYDEGETWSQPKELPKELCGDRFKAEYDPTTGKLLISFRQILPGIKPNLFSNENFVGRNWVAWVGTYEDLLSYADDDASNDRLGEAMIVLGTNNVLGSSGDNGYSGTVCKNGTFVLVSYGRFDSFSRNPYIMQAKFKLSDYGLAK